MSQNQLITLLTVVLLVVIVGSIVVLITTSSDTSTTPTPSPAPAGVEQSGLKLDVIGGQAYQLINKQLVREGALPVPPPAAVGKANPFL